MVNPKILGGIAPDFSGTGSKLAKMTAELAEESVEIRMIPHLLGLAQTKGVCRFNDVQVADITDLFRVYETTLSKSDLAKDLLAIGTEKGNPLGAEDIMKFLKVTNALEGDEQQNVVKFLKAAAEYQRKPVTKESAMQALPYEKYKAYELKKEKADKSNFYKRNPNWYDEAHIQERYEKVINDEVRVMSNPFQSSLLTFGKENPVEFITNSPPELVISIANCSNPAKYLEILQSVEMSRSLMLTPNSLVKAMEISGDNIGLVADLARSFYPGEIKAIVQLLSNGVEEGTIAAKELNHYAQLTHRHFNDVGSREMPLAKARVQILKDLGLDGKINLLPLETRYKEDIMDYAYRLGGSYEQGKRR